jgi:FkbM family methyltransferase
MIAPIFRLYRAAQYLKLTRSPAALRVLSKWPKLTLSALEATDGGKILLRGTDVETLPKDRQFLLAGSGLVKKLVDEANASFRAHPDGVLLEMSGVKLLLQHWEELFIAEEVFAQGVYNLRTEEPFVLIDVGMNVATTSLFFASKENCHAIHAFELFPKTVEKAQKNLALNPELATKIRIVPKGLASRSSRAELDYVEEWKGSVGALGLPEYADSKDARIQKASVEFISCEEAISEILRQHPNQNIVCKVDCEGAEYEILETLAASGLLPRISVLMIEWHRKGAAPIETILQKNDYRTLSFSPKAPTHGMIYAWRH